MSQSVQTSAKSDGTEIKLGGNRRAKNGLQDTLAMDHWGGSHARIRRAMVGHLFFLPSCHRVVQYVDSILRKERIRYQRALGLAFEH
jgi:hypothetical protein